MVIQFEPIPTEPTPPARKKPAAVEKVERPASTEGAQQSLPYAKPAPRGNAKSRRKSA